MYLLFYSLLTLFWVFDVMNMPFMEIFDTIYPINGIAWLIIWAVLPTPYRDD